MNPYSLNPRRIGGRKSCGESPITQSWNGLLFDSDDNTNGVRRGVTKSVLKKERLSMAVSFIENISNHRIKLIMKFSFKMAEEKGSRDNHGKDEAENACCGG